jgi:hypothetical protein
MRGVGKMAMIQRSPKTMNPQEKFSAIFPMPDKPGEGIPILPHNLDELSDDDLMSLYAEFMAWNIYAKSELVLAEIAQERADHDLTVIESRCLISQWNADDKNDRVTIAKAKRDVNPSVMSAREAHLSARAYRKLVEAVFERCDKSAQVLSRELTRRIGLAPRESKLWKYTP